MLVESLRPMSVFSAAPEAMACFFGAMPVGSLGFIQRDVSQRMLEGEGRCRSCLFGTFLRRLSAKTAKNHRPALALRFLNLVLSVCASSYSSNLPLIWPLPLSQIKYLPLGHSVVAGTSHATSIPYHCSCPEKFNILSSAACSPSKRTLANLNPPRELNLRNSGLEVARDDYVCELLLVLRLRCRCDIQTLTMRAWLC